MRKWTIKDGEKKNETKKQRKKKKESQINNLKMKDGKKNERNIEEKIE